ncbi:MAG: 4-hydroxy-3-methylbut-2-enyl diphosphate reductase [Candidatus Margulisiibacteriota bacterium]|nr:4-hydroxy-3-methylbut-2-enyl diphosphate reductase [Candidatus Margulisiibacteriota bacterium]
MQIFTAEHAGFCEGVERAYKIALDQTKTGHPVYMLGNLVHNTQVIDKFNKAGIKTAKTVSEIASGPEGIILISAHGVPPQVYQEAKDKGLGTIDTTCAWVKKAQKVAESFANENRLVVIVGDNGHTEVKGLIGWSKGKGVVVENPDGLKKIDIHADTRVGVLAQTTQSETHFKKIVAAIRKLAKDVKEYDTICGATSKRQEAAMDLARKVELVLVIGDKKSANTKRLTELCNNIGTETHQIQTVKELDPAWLEGKEKIGITAGASTPDWVIREVIEQLEH